MKKWLGIVLCGLLMMIGAAAADEQQPYFENGDSAVVYDNDTVQLTAIYTENCEKLLITYSFHNNHQEDFWVDVPSGAHSVPVSFSLYPVIRTAADNNQLFVNAMGYRTNPSTGRLVPTDPKEMGLWNYIDLLSVGDTPKPVISVPEQHTRKAALTLTMPNDTGVVYTAVLKDSKGNTLFELDPGEEWQAGRTYTISGNKFLIDDYYTLQLAGGKKRYMTTNSDEYTIRVGTPDTRPPIVFWTSFYDMYRALTMLQDYGIIKPTNETEIMKLTTYERPSRMELDWSTDRASVFASIGLNDYGYLFLSASEAAQLVNYGETLNLLLQEKENDNTTAAERLGLYGVNKTMDDLCSDLSIPVPSIKPGKSSFLVLPARLGSIGDEAFMGDTSLDEVVFQEGITEIGQRAFANSSVKKVYFPASLQDIKDDIFEGCEDIIIYAAEGTAAYEWAEQNGYTVLK